QELFEPPGAVAGPVHAGRHRGFLRLRAFARRDASVGRSSHPSNRRAWTAIRPRPAGSLTALEIRGASPLGLPYTLSRAPRRRAPFAWLTRCARSHLPCLLEVRADGTSGQSQE